MESIIFFCGRWAMSLHNICNLSPSAEQFGSTERFNDFSRNQIYDLILFPVIVPLSAEFFYCMIFNLVIDKVHNQICVALICTISLSGQEDLPDILMMNHLRQ